MKFITIDGDDVGLKITSSYLRNDVDALSRMNRMVEEKTDLVANFLTGQGFNIIFCAADGVAGYCECERSDFDALYEAIKLIADNEMTFSAGVGRDLRESYVALLYAKSSGKACLKIFESI